MKFVKPSLLVLHTQGNGKKKQDWWKPPFARIVFPQPMRKLTTMTTNSNALLGQKKIDLSFTKDDINAIWENPLKARCTIMHEPAFISIFRASLSARTWKPTTTSNCEGMWIYTDGACAHQSVHEIRSAGCGICSINQTLESSFALPGLDHQTAVRAEIFAIKATLESTTGNIDIGCDNKYAVDTVQAIINRSFHIPEDHLDLWSDIATGMLDRSISIHKVVAHTIRADVVRIGDVTLVQHNDGNEKADRLAVKGVMRHDERIIKEYNNLINHNIKLQALLVSITHEKYKREGIIVEDRGGDPKDAMRQSGSIQSSTCPINWNM